MYGSTYISVWQIDTLTRKLLRRKEFAKGDFTPWALDSSGSTHSQEREREMDSYGVIQNMNLSWLGSHLEA